MGRLILKFILIMLISVFIAVFNISTIYKFIDFHLFKYNLGVKQGEIKIVEYSSNAFIHSIEYAKIKSNCIGYKEIAISKNLIKNDSIWNCHTPNDMELSGVINTLAWVDGNMTLGSKQVKMKCLELEWNDNERTLCYDKYYKNGYYYEYLE